MAPTAAHPDVYGVLMEWRSEDAALTVAALRDGSASVYGTGGMEMMGGQGDDTVRGEARALVDAAAGLLDEASPASEFPYPAPGRVRFYLLTFGGVRVLDAALEAACERGGPYAALYEHGWAVFQRFLAVTGHEAEGNRSPATGGSGPARKGTSTACSP